jgi:uncharacterized protein (TIGR00369 family)
METAAASVSGMELLRDLRERGAAGVGVGRLLGLTLEDVAAGQVRFTLRTRQDFANPQGTLHGGITATLLDSAMGCAVLSALPPGTHSTTVDLSVTFLRPVPLDGTVLSAEGEVVHVGKRIATAHGRVHDRERRLVATATTTCQILEGGNP